MAITRALPFMLTPLELRLVRTGVLASFAGIAMYLAYALFPIPDVLNTAFFLLMGPSLVIAFAGIFPFLNKPTPTVSALLGTLFGVLAGATRFMFATVQLNNLEYIRGHIQSAESPAAQDAWRDILAGVFTVQNGMNWVSDFFVDGAAFLFAIVMWRHPGFGRLFSLLSLVTIGPHFVMKAITFPRPPAEAGFFDAGPLVGVWFLVITIQIARHLVSSRHRAAASGERP
jgi:hypothetical protein